MIQSLWNRSEKLSPGVRKFLMTECIFGLGAGISAFMLNFHLLALGMDEKAIGQVASIGFLASGLLSLPAGFLLQYMNRKTMLVAGLTLIGLGIGGYGLITTYAAVILCQLLWGSGMAMVLTSETQLLFEYCRSRKEERKAYSYMFASFMLFNGTGMLLGGLLPQWLGGATSVYQYSFFIAAGLLLTGALLRLAMLPPSKSPHAATGEAVEVRYARILPEARQALNTQGIPDDRQVTDARRVHEDGQLPDVTQAPDPRQVSDFRNVPAPVLRRPFYVPKPWKMLWLLTVMMFIGGLLHGFLVPFWNVILKFRLDMGDGAVSLALTISNLFIFLGAVATPRLTEQIGVHKAMLAVFAANTMAALLMAMALPASAFVLLLFFREGVFVMYTNLISSESMSAVPEEHRNLFAVMRTIARNGGTALASMVAGWILASANYTLPFIVTAAVLIVGLVLYVRWMKPLLDNRNMPREREVAGRA